MFYENLKFGYKTSVIFIQNAIRIQNIHGWEKLKSLNNNIKEQELLKRELIR